MRVVVGALSSFTFSARDADNNKITELRRNGNRLLAADRFQRAGGDPANYCAVRPIATTTG